MQLIFSVRVWPSVLSRLSDFHISRLSASVQGSTLLAHFSNLKAEISTWSKEEKEMGRGMRTREDSSRIPTSVSLIYSTICMYVAYLLCDVSGEK